MAFGRAKFLSKIVIGWLDRREESGEWYSLGYDIMVRRCIYGW